MSYDPNDPNGSCQTALAAALILFILCAVGVVFGIVKLWERFL